MPKETFLNLPDEKRERFLEAAIDEFADNDYQNASISRLVKRVGIAKGSFYQYFEDKQDLFLYLVNLMIAEKQALLTQIEIPDPDAGLFETLRWMLKLQTQFDFAHPRLTEVGYRAISGDVPFKDEMLEGFKAQGAAGLKAMVEKAIANGELKEDIDPDLATFYLSTIFNNLGEYLAERFGFGLKRVMTRELSDDDWEAVHDVFDRLIRMLESGIGR